MASADDFYYPSTICEVDPDFDASDWDFDYLDGSIRAIGTAVITGYCPIVRHDVGSGSTQDDYTATVNAWDGDTTYDATFCFHSRYANGSTSGGSYSCSNTSGSSGRQQISYTYNSSNGPDAHYFIRFIVRRDNTYFFSYKVTE